MTKLKYLLGATFTLKCSALYPIDRNNSKIKKILYFIWTILFVSSFVTTIVQCLVFLFINPFDLIEEAPIVMNGVFYISLLTNFIIFYMKSAKLVGFVKNINENFVEESDNEIEDIYMAESSKLSDKMAYGWTASLTVTSIGPILLSLATGNRNMPLPGWFPYDHQKSPFFEISYAWQTFCFTNLGIIYGATDMIYPCITVLMRQQFRILASNFKNTFYSTLLKCGISRETVFEFIEKNRNEDFFCLYGKYEQVFLLIQEKGFQKINQSYLTKNIKHHRTLLRHCEDVNDILSTFLLIKVAAVIFNLIFIAFTLTIIENEAMILGLCNYFLFASGELLIYTYSGQILTQNADFLWILYDSPWYLCDSHFQKLFLLVQMRTGKTVYTKAGNLLAMSAPAFIACMRTVFSYVAVLKELTDREK